MSTMDKHKKDKHPPKVEVEEASVEEALAEAEMDEALQTEAIENELTGQLEKALAEREEYLGMAQRVQADFENFRKRNSGVRAEAFEDGKRETVMAILPVLDNLDRAVHSETDETPLKTGVEQVTKQLRDVLAKLGVEEIDCHGKPFDPEEANAVMQAPAEGYEPGTVCDVMQKGYRMNGRVLRYAMVKVAGE